MLFSLQSFCPLFYLSLTTLLFAHLILMIFVLSNAQYDCNNGVISSDQYKGRFFEGFSINNTSPFNTTTAQNIYVCREVCDRNASCVAASFSRSGTVTENCRLFNVPNIHRYLTPDERFQTVLLLPAHCQPTVDIQMKSQDLCVGALLEEMANFTFSLRSGIYKAKLSHINGSVTCSEVAVASFWGCSNENDIRLEIEDMTSSKVVKKSNFTEHDGNKDLSQYISTESYFEFISGEDYAVVYTDPYYPNNDGRVCFTLLLSDEGFCQFQATPFQ